MLVILRYGDGNRVTKVDFYLSNASCETPKNEFARVALSAHRVEEAIKRGKSEAGLADYKVRNWRGWHHHQVLSLMASWFLSQETRRGKKSAPALTTPQLRETIAAVLRIHWTRDTPKKIARDKTRRLRRKGLARFYYYKQLYLLPPLRINQRR